MIFLNADQDPDPSLKSGANEIINISKSLYNRGKNYICYSIIAYFKVTNTITYRAKPVPGTGTAPYVL
jgi:hypothetical protein